MRRDWLAGRGTEAMTPSNPTRKHLHTCDADAYKSRNIIARMFRRDGSTAAKSDKPNRPSHNGHAIIP
jgi:hypothetical protein